MDGLERRVLLWYEGGYCADCETSRETRKARNLAVQPSSPKARQCDAIDEKEKMLPSAGFGPASGDVFARSDLRLNVDIELSICCFDSMLKLA